MEKSFKEVEFFPAEVKAQATALLQDMKLDALCKMVKSCKGEGLKPFFTAKTHKALCSFRVIVRETGSWQRSVSAFLQLHLKVLTPVDPFVLRNSDTLVQGLKMGLPGANYELSVDIDDSEDDDTPITDEAHYKNGGGTSSNPPSSPKGTTSTRRLYRL
ncbi:hypothetical protein HPB52_006911 [Rhipicephalus sanguineus]|uniref:Uncharacterized protein n=1 Tax=Rhipicephalus sanguineus TaxID=34632 RepID=A0A9D4QFS6_RHISA|nr:hypothetical protein HPB52_006911 [Rhipicephalus sanguineus]